MGTKFQWSFFLFETSGGLPKPKFNSEFTPEKLMVVSRLSPFLLGFGNCSGARTVKLQVGYPPYFIDFLYFLYFHAKVTNPTWMSQEVRNWLVNGLFHLLINGAYWGYNPLIRSPLILTSWDIQVLDPQMISHL